MDYIHEAFDKVKRADFLPEEVQGQASLDAPLPIGFGQTNSQPSTVETMLRWLEPEPGNRILDIGAGSGWASALLASIVGPKGKIFAVERIPELVEFGRMNARKAGYRNVEFHRAGKEYGLPEKAPYDRILVSASAQKLPVELLDQLKIGGKLVVPVRNDILEITKTSDDGYEVAPHPGFVFVPLIESVAK